MKIAIASGKGGTGKTTISVNLAALLQDMGRKVTLVDCDVEEPNSHFFLSTNWDDEHPEYVPVPSIDTAQCLGESCQQCARACQFKTMIWMVNAIMVFPELCHSCGLCNLVCPTGAISDTVREVGTVRHGQGRGIDFLGGLLRIGEAMAPPLIRKVKEAASCQDIQILDCPPGTSCPVITSLQGADFVILVTEPTPFGLNDLRLAVGLMRKLGYPFGVVINRAGMGDDCVATYLREESIPCIASIPHTQEAATAYSKGTLLIDAFPDFRAAYTNLWETVTGLIKEGQAS
ncbi:MAG: (4Fe-4S)-binding protein [Deltaproteobacteria bacterium]|nr:MAG: (4Fe-4S)-binding protein [Deltaproteobacteria bacterium]